MSNDDNTNHNTVFSNVMNMHEGKDNDDNIKEKQYTDGMDGVSPKQRITFSGCLISKSQMSSKDKINEMMECLEHNSKNYPSKADVCRGLCSSSPCTNMFNSHSSNSPIVNYYSPIGQNAFYMGDTFFNNFNYVRNNTKTNSSPVKGVRNYKTLQEQLESNFIRGNSFTNKPEIKEETLNDNIKKGKETDSESSEKELYMLSFNSDEVSDEDKTPIHKEHHNNIDITNENENTSLPKYSVFIKKEEPSYDKGKSEYKTQISSNDLSSSIDNTNNNKKQNIIKKQSTQVKKPFPKIKRLDPSSYIGIPLEQLIPNLHSLATDQGGCRYLQKLLETNPIDSIHLLYQPTIDLFQILSNDPFGNYFIQKLFPYLTTFQLNEIISLFATHLYEIGTNPHGTRVLQQLINHLSTEELQDNYLQCLLPFIIPLLKDLNGTHIVQKFATGYPKYSVIIDKIIIEHSAELASNRHGCCVIQHYFKKYEGELLQQLLNKLVDNTLMLIINQFGNYVIQTILLMNDITIGNIITSKITDNICFYAKHKYSSNVVEKCFDHCNGEIKQKLIYTLIQKETIEELIFDEHGNYIIQKALSCCENETQRTMLQVIIPLIDQLKDLPFGERIINRLHKAYPAYFENEEDYLYEEYDNKKKGRFKYNSTNCYSQGNSKNRWYRGSNKKKY